MLYVIKIMGQNCYVNHRSGGNFLETTYVLDEARIFRSETAAKQSIRWLNKSRPTGVALMAMPVALVRRIVNEV